MTIGYVGAGVFGSGTTSATSTYVAGGGSDCILALIGAKPYTVAPSSAANFKLAEITSGTVAGGNGTGSVLAQSWLKSTTPSTTSGDSFTVTSGSPAMAQGVRFSRDAGTVWDIASYAMADTVETGTSVSASTTIASGLVVTGDMLVISVVINDDVPTHTSQTFTVNGVTLGSITWLTVATTVSGNDGAMYVGYVSVTSGLSTGTTQYTATSSVSGSAAAAVTVTRLREADLVQSFDGTDEADITRVVSAGSGTGMSTDPVITAGNSIKYDTAQYMYGTASMRIFYAAGTTGAFANWAAGADGRSVARVYIRFDTLPINTNIIAWRTSAAQVGAITVSATGQPRAVNSPGSTLSTAVSPVAVNTWYRFEIAVTKGTTTSDGRVEAAYYLGESTTALWSYDSGATVNTGIADPSQFRVGSGSVAASQNWWFDSLRTTDLSSGWIGPVPKLYVNTSGVDALHLGTATVNAVYLGSTAIWP